MRRLAPLLALALSFGVYLIPLVGPHALFLLGETILRLPRSEDAAYAVRWMAVNVAVAAGLQAVAFGAALWVLRRPGWLRGAAAGLLGLALVVTANVLFLMAIPEWFLLEADRRAETGDWPEVCSVPGVSLMADPRGPVETPAGGWPEAWVRHDARPDRYGVLTAPDCQERFTDLPSAAVEPGGRVAFSYAVHQTLPGGAALIGRQVPATGGTTWLLLPAPGAALVPIGLPPELGEGPVNPFLSTDAAWGGVVAEVPGSGPPRLYRLVLFRARGGDAREVDLRPLGPATYVVARLDVARGRLLLWRDTELLELDLGGRPLDRTSMPSDLRVQPSSYRRLAGRPGAWLAWDAYREQDPYRLAWTLAGGSGRHALPRGRSVSAAALDPSGRFVALSVTKTVSLGTVRDAVIVLAADGSEAFRRYLPTYNRSEVAFLAGGYFAFSPVVDGASRTTVLRLPPAP